MRCNTGVSKIDKRQLDRVKGLLRTQVVHTARNCAFRQRSILTGYLRTRPRAAVMVLLSLLRNRVARFHVNQC